MTSARDPRSSLPVDSVSEEDSDHTSTTPEETKIVIFFLFSLVPRGILSPVTTDRVAFCAIFQI